MEVLEIAPSMRLRPSVPLNLLLGTVETVYGKFNLQTNQQFGLDTHTHSVTHSGFQLECAHARPLVNEDDAEISKIMKILSKIVAKILAKHFAILSGPPF